MTQRRPACANAWIQHAGYAAECSVVPKLNLKTVYIRYTGALAREAQIGPAGPVRASFSL